MLKPDAIKRGLKEELLLKLNQLGYRIVTEESVEVDADTILAHYAEVIEKLPIENFKEMVMEEFVNQTVHIVEVEGKDQDMIAKIREWLGATDPSKAHPHSIRGQYGEDSFELASMEKRMVRNLIHAADSMKSATEELKLWFKRHE